MQISTLPANVDELFPAFLKRFKTKLLISVPMKYKKTYLYVSAHVLTRTTQETAERGLKGTLAVICYSNIHVISCKSKGRTN